MVFNVMKNNTRKIFAVRIKIPLNLCSETILPESCLQPQYLTYVIEKFLLLNKSN